MSGVSPRNGRFLRHSSWVKWYRARIAAGLERCRNPQCKSPGGKTNPLTLDHLVARARGGRPLKGNATILCQRCNARKGDGSWPWLQSLADEEAADAEPCEVAA